MDKGIHILDPSEVAVSAHNLVDIQNYLVTFNKEIEGTDPSSLPIITDADSSDVSDILSSVSGAQSLHVGIDSAGGGHFSTAFYTEQSLLDSGLGEDSAHNIHSLEGVESDIVTQIKQEAAGLDLDDASMASVHAQLAGLTGSISDMTAQELIMTAVNDALDINEGKVIRIVSLSQDGSILSLGDGSHMQILDDEHSHIGSDLKDLSSSLEALGQPLIMSSSSHDLLGSSPSSCMSIPAPTTTITSSTVDLLNSEAVSEGSSDQGEGLSTSQSHLVALQSGIEGLSPETLQALTLTADGAGSGTSLVLNAGGSGLQTFALVPSEGQNGEMQYVLLVTRTNGNNLKDLGSLDEEDGHLEDFIQEDGSVKHILKITPKKLFPASLINSSQLTCNYCNYTSPKRYLLTRHMKTHSEDRPHKCDICNRGFKTYASLTNHVNTHTGIRPHKCKECQAAFTTSGELVRHVRYRHTFEKPHKCPECDYASVELSKLKRHLRSHTGERPYQCGHCTYASPDTYKLKRHMRIHTGEKPYLCDICNARFTQSNSLKAHKLIHSGNKPVFQCQYCPTTCGRKTDLKIHIQKLHCSDEPVTCRKCGESFQDRYHFKLHWKTREADKSYRCEICEYAACSQHHLDSHILIHTGEKPFECDECHLTFRQKQLLKRHKIQHHAAEDQPTSDKDKSQECAACNKSVTEKGDTQQHTCGEELSEDDTMSAGSADGESSFCSITAEHVLQGNLMQEWRDGKLGNAPQVVIVHPDGRIEEVTPKLQLPPDRSLEGVGAKTAKNIQAGQSGSGGKMPVTTGARVQKNIVFVSHSPEDMDEDDSHREASTQVELASDTSDEEDHVDDDEDEENDEDDDEMDSSMHYLTARAAEGSTLGSVLEAGGITLFPAASSSEIENMIASLPLISTPVTFAQPTPVSQDQQIPTIDAPEILAHLDLTTHIIKQETADGSDGENITLTLFPASSDSSVASIAPAKVVVARGVRSGSQGQTVVLTSGRKVSAPATSAALASKAMTLVASDVSKAGERKTRVLKRKEPEDTPLPAKRIRKTLIDQQYMYI